MGWRLAELATRAMVPVAVAILNVKDWVRWHVRP